MYWMSYLPYKFARLALEIHTDIVSVMFDKNEINCIMDNSCNQ